MKQRGVRDFLFLLLRGIAMGAADVVPGVSGGTIAFITGIYQELLDSLRELGPRALGVLWHEGWRAFWQRINGSFLCTILGGILISFLSLARLIAWLLAEHPQLVWSFFFGLIIAAIIHMARQIRRWSLPVWLALLGGSLAAYLITELQPATVEPGTLYLFLAGAVAICAMILPGISGSFILLMLGVYAVVIEAVKSLDAAVLGVVVVGCMAGLMVFSRLLSWLMHRFYQLMLAVLTGFLVGSLNLIWPWKHTLVYFEGNHGRKPLIQENVMPFQFQELTGDDPRTLFCLALMAAGIALVLVIEVLGRYGDDSAVGEKADNRVC